MNRYETFWNRLLASIFDALVFLPVYLLTLHIPIQDMTSWVVFSLLTTFAWAFYYVYLEGKYGQTLGKRLVKIKVYDLDERSVIGYKRAFYRSSVPIILGFIEIFYVATGYTLDALLGFIVSNGALLWLILELITMLTNSKRRALHDFMAGSVVIHLIVQQREAALAAAEQIAPQQ